MRKNEEIKLLKLCKKNNRQAQGELYRLHSDLLFAICLRYCNDKSIAEDCFHDSFEKIFTKIHQFKGGNLKAWMCKITVNTCLQFLREKKKFTILENGNIPYELATDDAQFNNEMNNIPSSTLFQAIRDLPTQYRLVFNLYYIEEKSHQKIAQLLQISVGTSKSNLFKARKKLKEILKNENNINHYHES